jgi:hypothetical protein
MRRNVQWRVVFAWLLQARNIAQPTAKLPRARQHLNATAAILLVTHKSFDRHSAALKARTRMRENPQKFHNSLVFWRTFIAGKLHQSWFNQAPFRGVTRYT